MIPRQFDFVDCLTFHLASSSSGHTTCVILATSNLARLVKVHRDACTHVRASVCGWPVLYSYFDLGRVENQESKASPLITYFRL